MAVISDEIRKELDDYIKELSIELKRFKIYLYGSYAYGEPTKDSDIDIMIFSNDFENDNPIEIELFLRKKARKYKNYFEPIGYKYYDNTIGLQYNAVTNGILLYSTD